MNDQDRYMHEVGRYEFETDLVNLRRRRYLRLAEIGDLVNLRLAEIAEDLRNADVDPAWDVFANIRSVCMQNGEAEREYAVFLATHAPLAELDVGCEFDD
jgi:hypothetical protein